MHGEDGLISGDRLKAIMCTLDEVIIKVTGEIPGAAWEEVSQASVEASGEEPGPSHGGQVGEWEGREETTEERSLSLSANFLTG